MSIAIMTARRAVRTGLLQKERRPLGQRNPSQRRRTFAGASGRVDDAFAVYDPQLGQLCPELDPLEREALSVAHPAASKVSSNKTPRHSLAVFGIARLLSANVGRENF
jgi:hypothetical protein